MIDHQAKKRRNSPPKKKAAYKAQLSSSPSSPETLNAHMSTTSRKKKEVIPRNKRDHITHMYTTFHKTTGMIGGNGYNGAMYGELTRGSMDKIFEFMKTQCEFGKSSRFIDIGSGLGKPSYHALLASQCELSFGIELENIRHILCMRNVLRMCEEMEKLKDLLHKEEEEEIEGMALDANIMFIQGDVFQCKTLDPFTHIYQFDLAFGDVLHRHMASLFNKSASTQYLITFKTPKVVANYGYKVDLLGKLPTSMHGSSEGHTAYFFIKSSYAEIKRDQEQLTNERLPRTPSKQPTSLNDPTSTGNLPTPPVTRVDLFGNESEEGSEEGEATGGGEGRRSSFVDLSFDLDREGPLALSGSEEDEGVEESKEASRRTSSSSSSNRRRSSLWHYQAIDPVFQRGIDLVHNQRVKEEATRILNDFLGSGRPQRTRRAPARFHF